MNDLSPNNFKNVRKFAQLEIFCFYKIEENFNWIEQNCIWITFNSIKNAFVDASFLLILPRSETLSSYDMCHLC